MIKKLVKYAKIAIAMALIASLTLPSYATVGASDGSAFVTKAEFDAALSDFNARLTTFEAGINSKIDSQVSSYLDRNGIWNGKEQIMLSYGEPTNCGWWQKDAEASTNPVAMLNKTIPSKKSNYIYYGPYEPLFKANKTGLAFMELSLNASAASSGQAFNLYKPYLGINYAVNLWNYGLPVIKMFLEFRESGSNKLCYTHTLSQTDWCLQFGNGQKVYKQDNASKYLLNWAVNGIKTTVSDGEYPPMYVWSCGPQLGTFPILFFVHKDTEYTLSACASQTFSFSDIYTENTRTVDGHDPYMINAGAWTDTPCQISVSVY